MHASPHYSLYRLIAAYNRLPAWSSGVGPPPGGAGGRDLLEHLDGTTDGSGGARKLHGDDVSSSHPLLAK